MKLTEAQAAEAVDYAVNTMCDLFRYVLTTPGFPHGGHTWDRIADAMNALEFPVIDDLERVAGWVLFHLNFESLQRELTPNELEIRKLALCISDACIAVRAAGYDTSSERTH